jgi:cysteine synthase
MIQIIDKVVNKQVRENTVKRFREKGIILPTFAEMRNPDLIPEKVKAKLKDIGLWDFNPLNLFRITWKNEPKAKGGMYGGVNYIELPSALTGVQARIILLVGKYFPTGAHKVGAAYGCLAPRIITGEFDPGAQKAVWPSTGNYCRGGAFDSILMGCQSVAILPEGMSAERFNWLKETGSEIIATHGCESNVKEIYDACWDIRKNRKDCVIFNQFDEFGNPTWHYNVTARAMEEVFKTLKGPKTQIAAIVSATGSAGTISSGDYLRTISPHLKVVANEAIQCPTLLNNGFGDHRIEGIGDKHVPWVHNVKNTDAVTAVDDEDCIRIMRLFNEKDGKEYLKASGVPRETIDRLDLLGISGIGNMLGAIKTAKYYEMTSDDIIFSLATDSMEMYQSRLQEQNKAQGAYSRDQAIKDFEKCLLGQAADHLRDLTYYDRRAIHNLKYYTWVEQQAKEVADLEQLWYDREIWPKLFSQAEKWDAMIKEFNEETGVLKNL